MKQHTALTLTPGSSAETSLLRRMQDIQDTISRRAYELFASSGFTDGHDLGDWFLAESELLQPIPMELSETEKELTVKRGSSPA
jgi:hypothetical protein